MRAASLEERGKDLRHRAERAGREVGDLDRRQGRRRVLECAGPAEVVEIVRRALHVPSLLAESGDRAVDGTGARIVGSDAEARGNARPEALEDDVRTPEQRAGELEAAWRFQIAHDRLLACVQRVVPRRCRVP